MEKYLVLYITPPTVLAKWAQTDPETKAKEETRMQGEWNAWMEKHRGAVLEIAGAGKTKRVTKEGVADATNDVMLYSIVQSESPEAAAAIFEDHPHLEIPESSIEIMKSTPLTKEN